MAVGYQSRWLAASRPPAGRAASRAGGRRVAGHQRATSRPPLGCPLGHQPAPSGPPARTLGTSPHSVGGTFLHRHCPCSEPGAKSILIGQACARRKPAHPDTMARIGTLALALVASLVGASNVTVYEVGGRGSRVRSLSNRALPPETRLPPPVLTRAVPHRQWSRRHPVGGLR